ncbi:Short-chain dehydrogenase TIC 32, chloroplastic [Turnera subulata]|uniref:Short-chain dehydrogenase TIC 32, chloroplastic n=1 Tax=Turnera subulata TaxID=218843 RepID=A0A9Q0J1I3_9ROSI|nr:Short-chain dehydrogenase TIC 32, chloroplastic [Turnera subulata]
MENCLLTQFSFHNSGLVDVLGRLVLKNIQQGAATTCYVALHPQVKGISGGYFRDSNEARASPLGRDTKLAKRLWDFSASLVNGIADVNSSLGDKS